MKPFQAELALAKDAVAEALQALAETSREDAAFRFDDALPREVKAEADRSAEKAILRCLQPSGIGLLSEEAGRLWIADEDGLRWVVDPLDGTVNYVRGLAPCAVSVALWNGDTPVFGVIGEFPSRRIAWGGAALGAYIDDRPVRVSAVDDKAKAVLCTGFPSRFDFSDDNLLRFVRRIGVFGKVRMLGAASLSLLHVAKGAADGYAEQDIMIWDVAAGLALVEGAGGKIEVTPGRSADALNVLASNGCFAMKPDEL